MSDRETPAAEAAEAPAEAPAVTGQVAFTSAGTVSVEDLHEALMDVVDPELGIDVVNLGLIYGIHIDEGDVATVDMTLTSAACPLTDVIEDQARTATDGLVKDLRINWVWMPPWGPDKITDEGRDQLRALGFNV
ncbi:metal-sulfur cluster assembly factor [Kitasatospora sp. NPDC059571]|uniref:metal-sulfur cluster assembly factor n=1 Tax=Kitasatospora sp. NPDC059571 TaxID=3346871 RepID=UPI003679C806